MPNPSSPQRIRLTISVSPEAHAVFKRMADATGMSLGMAMGEWLDDTSEGADLLAQKLAEARQSPRLVVREMQAALTGMQDVMADLMTDLKSGKKVPKAAPGQPVATRAAAAAPSPRLVIRGVKSPSKSPKGAKS